MHLMKSGLRKRVEYNERLLVWEGLIANFGIWLVSPYIAILAIELGASDHAVGLLTSMPALVSMLAMIPLSRIAQRYSTQKAVAAVSAFGNRIFYLFFAVAPFLGWLNPTVLIAVSVAMAVPGALLNIVWANLQSQLFPAERRASILGYRNAVIKVVSIFATFGGGYFLAVVGYPRNYSVLFGLTFIACMISVYLITRIDESREGENVTLRSRDPGESYLSQLKAILRDDDYGNKFILFVVSMFVFHFGMNTTAPIWPIYHVRELGLSTTVVGLFNFASGALAVAGFWYLGRVAGKRGDEFVLNISVLCNATFPLLYSLIPSIPWMVLLQSHVGFWNAGWSLTVYTILLNSSKAQYRPACVATFHTAMSMTGFLAPMFGTLLLGYMPARVALRVSSGIRIAGWLTLVVGLRMLSSRAKDRARTHAVSG
jgi:MFS family permease